MKSKAIGLKIQELRLKKRWSEEELAKKVGMTPTHLTSMEIGRQPIRAIRLLKFAAVFEVPPSYLLVEGHDGWEDKVTRKLQRAGLGPSKKLRKALTNPEFVDFLEECAKAVKYDRKNLQILQKRVRVLARKAGVKQGTGRSAKAAVRK